MVKYKLKWLSFSVFTGTLDLRWSKVSSEVGCYVWPEIT